MMENMLNFPKEYEVKGQISKEKFLQAGNFSVSEKKLLEKYMDSVNILYDIRYPDESEMVVIGIDLNNKDKGKYSYWNSVASIGMSVPYQCLLLFKRGSVLHFFAFDKRKNKRNSNRTVIENTKSYLYSPFRPAEYETIYKELLEKMRQAISDSKSANELNSKWYDLIDSYASKKRFLAYDLNYDRKFSVKEEIKPKSDMINNITFCPDDEEGERILAGFFAANARPLYDEACEKTKVDEEDWIIDYLLACKEYAFTCLDKSINSDIVNEITDAFYYETDDEQEEMMNILDVDKLKYYIGKDYFCEEEE